MKEGNIMTKIFEQITDLDDMQESENKLEQILSNVSNITEFVIHSDYLGEDERNYDEPTETFMEVMEDHSFKLISTNSVLALMLKKFLNFENYKDLAASMNGLIVKIDNIEYIGFFTGWNYDFISHDIFHDDNGERKEQFLRFVDKNI